MILEVEFLDGYKKVHPSFSAFFALYEKRWRRNTGRGSKLSETDIKPREYAEV